MLTIMPWFLCAAACLVASQGLTSENVSTTSSPLIWIGFSCGRVSTGKMRFL